MDDHKTGVSLHELMEQFKIEIYAKKIILHVVKCNPNK